MEIWKHIPNYPKFEASTLGRIRSLKFKKIRKPWLELRGYLKLSIPNKDGKKRGAYVHRLIAETFIEKSGSDGLQVDHVNRVRSDNRLENLRLVSLEENLLNRCLINKDILTDIIKLYESGLDIDMILEILKRK